jgi:hypothetical protein
MSSVVFILANIRWKPCVLFRFHIVCNVSWTSGQRCWHNSVCNGVGPEGTVELAYEYIPYFFFCMAQQSLVDQSLLIVEASRSHFLDTPHSVGLLWTSDQPVAETSTWHHTTLTTDRHPCPRWDFFFACPGFFPFDPFFYCLNPFVLHVTLRSILLSLRQTQHKHPCPRWDSNP